GSIANFTDTQIVVITPMHPAGTVSVSVTAAGGTTISTNAYTYVDPPQITGISPDTGLGAGGQSVTITGVNLSSVTQVTFGGNAAIVASSTDTQLIVTTPSHAAGTVDVAVTTAGGSVTLT